MDVDSLRSLIQHKRENRSVRDVAAEIGINYSVLYSFLTGTTPGLDVTNAMRLAAWLDLDTSEVLRLTGHEWVAQRLTQPDQRIADRHLRALQREMEPLSDAEKDSIVAIVRRFANTLRESRSSYEVGRDKSGT